MSHIHTLTHIHSYTHTYHTHIHAYMRIYMYIYTPNVDEDLTNVVPAPVKVGNCLEVYWDDLMEWYPCVIKDETIDSDDVTTISLCAYDDKVTRWHDMKVVQHRLIRPTRDRIKKLSVQVIRKRLNELKGECFDIKKKKSHLVDTMTDILCVQFDVESTNVVTTTTPVVTTTTPVEMTTTHVKSTTTVTTTPDGVERSKFGMSHVQRMVVSRKRKFTDTTTGDEEHTRSTKVCRSTVSNMTANEVERGIGDYGRALYTLSTRGNKQSDRQSQRDGYNLLSFRNEVGIGVGLGNVCDIH